MSISTMTEQFLQFKTPALISTALLLIVSYVASSFLRRKPLAKYVIGKKNDPDFSKAMLESYRNHPDVPYMLPQPHLQGHLILPNRYIDELKSLPGDKLSFENEINMRFVGHYSSLGNSDPALVNSVKMDLTRSIGKVLEELQKEADFAIPANFGTSEEWTEVQVYGKSLRIIALLSGRVFVGYPLCRNEEWIAATIMYTISAFNVSQPLLKIPSFIRPIVAPFLPEVKSVREHRATATKFLTPIITERLAAMKENPDVVLPNDAVQMMIRNFGEKANDIPRQALMQLVLSIAAIHTTTMNFTHLIYDLCANPEVVGELREELESVLESDGGVLIKQSITKLKKMDSFMKESQRFNPPNCLSMERIATTDLRLSDGLIIPKGTSIAFNSIGPNMDPEKYPNPEKFDAFRFSRLRDQPGNETKFQFVTTGPENLNFGHGLHACPGRFFASNELKVALTYVLRNYDFKFREGEGRPKNLYRGITIRPDVTGMIMFRKRRDI